jgi:lipopolysaccharide biosynthesis protein
MNIHAKMRSFLDHHIGARLPSALWYPLRRALKAVWCVVILHCVPERWRYPHTPEAARAIELDYSLALPLSLPVTPAPSGRLAAIVHLYYENLADEIRAYLEEVPFPLDIYVSTRNDSSKAAIEKIFAGWRRGTVVVRVVPNQGRDIAPKLLAFSEVYDHYSYVLFLHGKRSRHSGALALWRYYLFESLCGSADIVNEIITIFEHYPKIGMIAAQHFEPIRDAINWGENYKTANKLARWMGFQLDSSAPLDFPSGSMFWARTASLKPLLDLNLSLEAFSKEKKQTDGTLAHAIERMFFHVCEYSGYDWIKIARPELAPRTPSIMTLDKLTDLDTFLKQHTFHLLEPGNVRPRAERPLPITQACPKLGDVVRARFRRRNLPAPPDIGAAIDLQCASNEA